MQFTKTAMQDELARFLTLFGEQIARLWDVSDLSWTTTEAVQESTVWKALSAMYDYGVMGIPTEDLQPGRTMDGAVAHTEKFLQAMDTMPMKIWLHERRNAPPRLAIRTAQIAVARMVLDGGDRATDYATEEFGLGKGNWGYLTLAEVALLADMDERSVRNAANPKLPDPLKPEQVGKRSLVRPEEAHRWLASRKGFVPTRKSEASGSLQQNFNIELTEDLVKQLQLQAENSGTPVSIVLEQAIFRAWEQLGDKEQGK